MLENACKVSHPIITFYAICNIKFNNINFSMFLVYLPLKSDKWYIIPKKKCSMNYKNVSIKTNRLHVP